MKRLLISYRRLAGMTLSLLLIMLTSCYKDDSKDIEEWVPNIEIADFNENGYTIISYADNYLDINPQITTGYKEEELTYNWYVINTAEEVASNSNDPNPYEMEWIAEGKDLHYNVRLFPGEYKVVLEVKAPNEYTVYKTAQLSCTTLFSEGFYILKETNDGNTELDLFNTSSADGTSEPVFMEDVLEQVHGEAMKGAPQNISMASNHSYIDEASNEMTYANTLTVTTKQGDISMMRTSDLKVVMNRDNMLFTQFGDDEMPYKVESGFWCNLLTTNKGVRSQYQASLSASASGKYGVTNGMTVDEKMAYDSSSMGVFFWSPDVHNIVYCDYNATCTYADKKNNNVGNLSAYSCEFIGSSQLNKTIVYVLRHRNGMAWVLPITSQLGGGWAAGQIMPAQTVAPNFAKATGFKVCVNEATVIYGIYDNKIYAFDFVNNIEKQIIPEGVGEDEKIVYITDQYIGYGSVNNFFVVGTVQGDSYTLRFYSNFGGQPDGAPLYVITGHGYPKAMRYTTGADIGMGMSNSMQD